MYLRDDTSDFWKDFKCLPTSVKRDSQGFCPPGTLLIKDCDCVPLSDIPEQYRDYGGPVNTDSSGIEQFGQDAKNLTSDVTAIAIGILALALIGGYYLLAD